MLKVHCGLYLVTYKLVHIQVEGLEEYKLVHIQVGLIKVYTISYIAHSPSVG